MTTFVSLPIELWWCIIEQALWKPLMSSFDPLNESYLQTTPSQWINPTAFHAQKRIFRLVCQSWKTIVDTWVSSSQYVELRSLMRNSGTTDQLLHARRIKGSRISYDEFCGFVSNRALHSLESGSEEKDNTNVYFDAEIMTHVGVGMVQYITNRPTLCPRLKALHLILAYNHHDLLNQIAKNLPQLVFLSIRCRRAPGFGVHDVLDLINLTTLIIKSDASGSLSPCNFEHWKLPSLTYLELSRFPGIILLRRFLTTALPNLGAKLKTLKFEYDIYPEAHTPEDIPLNIIWTSCPQLEYLDIHLFDILYHSPPPHHQIKYISNNSFFSSLSGRRSMEVPSNSEVLALRFCSLADHLVAIRDAHVWEHELADWNRHGDDWLGSARLLVSISRRLEAQNIRFEDSLGRTLREYEEVLVE